MGETSPCTLALVGPSIGLRTIRGSARFVHAFSISVGCTFSGAILIFSAIASATCTVDFGCFFPVGAAANRVGGLSGFTTHFPKKSRVVIAIAWFFRVISDSDGANATFRAFVELSCAAIGGRGEWQQSKEEKIEKHGQSEALPLI